MRILSFFLLIHLVALNSFSQDEVPRFHRIPIGTSGCEMYSPDTAMEFELSYSEDSSEVWTGSITVGDFEYDVICIVFSEPLGDTKEELEYMLISYLDFLKGQFGIVESVGYGTGHTLESNPEAAGVIDYWVDEEGYQGKVKGWADTHYMGIMFTWGLAEINYGVSELYHNGFRFPE